MYQVPGCGTTVVVAGVARRRGTRRVRCCDMHDALSHFIIPEIRISSSPELQAIEIVVRKTPVSRVVRAGSKRASASSLSCNHMDPLPPSFPRAKIHPPPSTAHRIRWAGYDLSLKPVWRVDQMYASALGRPVLKHPHTHFTHSSIFPVKKHRCSRRPPPPNDSKDGCHLALRQPTAPTWKLCILTPVCEACACPTGRWRLGSLVRMR